MNASLPSSQITLGILAGGRATRLGGIDKAWIERDGTAQVVRWQRRFADETCRVLVSANRERERHAALGLEAIGDSATGDFGPIAGLDALFSHCTTEWLLTLPVDLVGVNDCLLPSLIAGRSAHGAYAIDHDGPQPLVALWRVLPARTATAAAIEAGQTAVHALQAQLGLASVRFDGVRFGNLNTPDDLRAAGIPND